MITDVFLKRYPETWYPGYSMPRRIQVLLRQAAQIVGYDICPFLCDREDFFQRVHGFLAREVGDTIADQSAYLESSFEAVCLRCLMETYSVHVSHGTMDAFVKTRLSLIELVFREFEKEVTSGSTSGNVALVGYLKKQFGSVKNDNESPTREALRRAVDELNYRMREAGVLLHYHNGMIQRAEDSLTTENVHEPFWELVKEVKWVNVDSDMKEAIDRRDTAGRDAVLYALKALESTIKIISDDRGWTRGNERGAANYIDNLVSAGNGRFIDPWEAEGLKLLFSKLRNPHGHGPGSAPQPSLSLQQTTWAIEAAMSWIKSLVHRL